MPSSKQRKRKAQAAKAAAVAESGSGAPQGGANSTSTPEYLPAGTVVRVHSPLCTDLNIIEARIVSWVPSLSRYTVETPGGEQFSVRLADIINSRTPSEPVPVSGRSSRRRPPRPIQLTGAPKEGPSARKMGFYSVCEHKEGRPIYKHQINSCWMWCHCC